jgi:NitT/TauT family transport system substrate-binding protein
MDSSGTGLGRKLDRRVVLGGAFGAGAVAALSGCNWLSSSGAAAPLTVGGLAVTCNLTLPVACEANATANGAGSPSQFAYSKFSGWPELKESLMSGDLQAAYMLAPMVMDLADKNVPVKIVSIGHRSGAVIMVHSDSPYRRFATLPASGSRSPAGSRSTSCSCARCSPMRA